jgi:hypothetical protein
MRALLSLLVLFGFLFAQDLYQEFVKEQVKTGST